MFVVDAEVQIAAYEVTPADGSSRSSYRMVFGTKGVGRLMEPLLARVVSHDCRRDGRRLQVVLVNRSESTIDPSVGPYRHG